jgi:hypothetical protein
MLDQIDAILPIGQDEWELVVTRHASSFNTGRNADAIRCLNVSPFPSPSSSIPTDDCVPIINIINILRREESS